MLNLNTIFSRIMGVGEVQRQSIASFLSQIAITSLGFLSTVYFAHAVGAGILGAYFLFLAYYGIISMVADGGFGIAAMKRISEGEEQNEYLSAFFVVRTIFMVLVIIALVAFRGYFIDLNASGAFIWLLLALIASNLFGTISYGIAGSGKMGIRAVSYFIGEITRIATQIAAVFFGFNIAGLVGGFVAGLLATAFIEMRFFNLRLVSFGWRHIRDLSTFSFWLFLSSGGIMLYSNTDVIMIGYYLSNSDVGVYRVALQFAAVAMFIGTALGMTLLPHVSRWGKTEEIELIEKSLTKAFSLSLLLAVPVLWGGILLGDRLFYFLYGAEFVRGYWVLMILLIVQIISIFQQFFGNYLVALGYERYVFKVILIAALLNIALNFILIPTVGITGAAVATLFTTTLNAILAHRILSRRITIRVDYDNLLNILKASIVMSLFVGIIRMFMPLSSIWLIMVLVVLGGAVYGILLLKFDIKMRYELKGIAMQMNLPWLNWL